jgi:hypothetical protein
VAPPPAEPTALPPELRLALITEAARRSRVCWLSYGYDGAHMVPDRLVWHVWHEGAVVVVSGPSGNNLPGIDRAEAVDVTLRSRDDGGRLVTWRATAEVLTPGTEAWERHAVALLGVRLNLPDPPATRRAWAERGTILRLPPPLP